jgi:hypothetical protein
MHGKIVDCCSPSGSGIVTRLTEKGYFCGGVADAFSDFDCSWVASNPPYNKKVVDKIIWKQVNRLPDILGVCMLLRSNFDFAKSRWDLFAGNPYYYGQIHMLFRPYWSENREASPIHNYVWHVWYHKPSDIKRVLYWREK